MKTTRFFLLTAMFALTLLTAATRNAAANKGLPVAVQKQSAAFSFFRTHRQGKGITATWGVDAPEAILGFTVQRTYEDPTDAYAYWEDVGTVAFDAARAFTYTDKEVFSGVVSYRIVALLSDGTTLASAVSQVRIVSRK